MPPINRIAGWAADLADWRHAIHRRPELAFDCHETAAFVAERLRAFGADEVHEGLARTGVVAVIRGRGPGPAVGLRADMDALPMPDESGTPWASEIPGRAHACGHDGHTAMLLGAARYLAETRAFAGTAVLIFQPAEEDGGGARAMLDEGLLDRFPVREVYALHTHPGTPVGHVATVPGPIMAAVDDAWITLRGRGGHAAKPHTARDPIPGACALVGALQTIATRDADPMERLVVSVTQVHAGTAINVIPEDALVTLTLRTYDDATRRLARERTEAIAHGVAATFGLTADIRFEIGYPPTVNDEAATAFALSVAQEIAPAHGRFVPEMGSEDFAYLLAERPGCYLLLGNGDSPPCHHPAFDMADEALPVGASLLARLVERALPPE